MESRTFPIVEEGLSAGQAARLASRAGVGAVLVRTSRELILVDVRGPGRGDETIVDLASSWGLKVRSRTTPAVGGDKPRITAIHGKTASISLPQTLLQRFGGPVGFKACSVDSEHVYPPTYAGSQCPRGDGGTLQLRLV